MQLDAEDLAADADEPSEAGEPAQPVGGADGVVADRAKKSGGAVGAALGGAMLAVGQILEPEKTTVEIVQTNDDPEPDDLPFTLDFGDLPPLD